MLTWRAQPENWLMKQQKVSMSGGGGSHNDLPKKKDDEWDRLLFDAFKHLGEWTHPRHKANKLAR